MEAPPIRRSQRIHQHPGARLHRSTSQRSCLIHDGPFMVDGLSSFHWYTVRFESGEFGSQDGTLSDLPSFSGSSWAVFCGVAAHTVLLQDFRVYWYHGGGCYFRGTGLCEVASTWMPESSVSMTFMKIIVNYSPYFLQGRMVLRRVRQTTNHNPTKKDDANIADLILIKWLQGLHPASLHLRDQPQVEGIHIQTHTLLPALKKNQIYLWNIQVASIFQHRTLGVPHYGWPLF